MSILEFSNDLGVLLLNVDEILVPFLVEFIVLLDVGLLTLLPLLSLGKD
jgi:hypothetical protein